MARKIAIPEEVENKCRQYCKSRKFKEGTFLRLLILNKVPSLHDAATLNKIGRKKCNFLYYLIEDDLKKILEES